jgi:hypothetical protein
MARAWCATGHGMRNVLFSVPVPADPRLFIVKCRRFNFQQLCALQLAIPAALSTPPSSPTMDHTLFEEMSQAKAGHVYPMLATRTYFCECCGGLWRQARARAGGPLRGSLEPTQCAQTPRALAWAAAGVPCGAARGGPTNATIFVG